jgi:hypothetical protein
MVFINYTTKSKPDNLYGFNSRRWIELQKHKLVFNTKIETQQLIKGF